MKERVVPAAIGQRLLWLLQEYRGKQGELNCPITLRLEGDLLLEGLEASLQHLIATHDSLRTTFARSGRQLQQVIREPQILRLQLEDESDKPDPEAAVRTALREELERPIDPRYSPLRLRLWRVSATSHFLCVNLHHLVTDTWSCIYLQRQLVLCLRAWQAGQSLPDARCWQFSQFAAWQTRQLGGGFQRHLEYWQAQLRGAQPVELPLLARRGEQVDRRASRLARLDAATTARFQRLALQHRTTPFAVSLAAFYATLLRLTGRRDLAVGTLFANRTRPEVENTVGFLSNLIVLRTRIAEGASFAQLLVQTRETILGGIAHQAVPYHVVPRDPARSQAGGLDEVVFQMLSESIEEVLQAGNLRVHCLTPEVTGRFDLELAVMPLGAELALKLYFTESRLSPDWAELLVREYVDTSREVSEQPDAPLGGPRDALEGMVHRPPAKEQRGSGPAVPGAQT